MGLPPGGRMNPGRNHEAEKSAGFCFYTKSKAFFVVMMLLAYKKYMLCVNTSIRVLFVRL